MSYNIAEVEKAQLAAEHGLAARFAYQGENDYQPHGRQVTVDEFDGDRICGETVDGYRQFRLDRIVGKIAIR